MPLPILDATAEVDDGLTVVLAALGLVDLVGNAHDRLES